MKCLDTTFLVDLVQAPDQVRALIMGFEESSEMLTTTAINLYEALAGAYSLKDRRKGAKVQDKLERTVARMDILPLRDVDARKAAQMAGNLRRQGVNVGVDVLVASIAVNHGCDGIVTRNVGHFKPIEKLTGLKVVAY